MAKNLAVKAASVSDDDTSSIEPDLLKAAERGDMDEAMRALSCNPNCINDIDIEYKMNALQLAIVEFHHDMAIYLLKATKISARHKDRQGRDALHLGLLFSDDYLCRELNERWTAERFQELQVEKNKVIPINFPRS